MRSKRGSKVLNIFLSLSFFMTVNSSVIMDSRSADHILQDQIAHQNLSPMSLFNPIKEKDGYLIKDLALAEQLVVGHLKMDKNFLNNEGRIEEQISLQTIAAYDLDNMIEINYKGIPAGVLLPLSLLHMQTESLGKDRKYYVFITPEILKVTVFTEDEKNKVEKEGLEFIHAERKENGEIRAFIKHELWTDRIIANLGEKDKTAFGELDINIKTVVAFLNAIGAKQLAIDLLETVKCGRVFRIDPDLEVNVPGYGKLKIHDSRIMMDHASNLGIYVKGRNKDNVSELHMALIHEAFARAGTIKKINDNEEIRGSIKDVYDAFAANDSGFEIRKNAAVYAINRTFEDLKQNRTVETLSFNVDLNAIRDRDLSLPLAGRERLEAAKNDITKWKVATRKEIWDSPNNDTPEVSAIQKRALKLYSQYRMYKMSIRDILDFAFDVFDGMNYAVVKNAVEHLIVNESAIDMDAMPNELTPTNFHEIARELSRWKSEGSFTDVDNINFVINRFVFDFFRSERRASELLFMAEEIQRERDFPGAGRLPTVCAMQDLHGAANRAMALVGFAAGLPPDIIKRIRSIEDLQRLLDDAGIEMRIQDILFIGLNDLYDRGEDPIGAFELIRWLAENRKLKYILGNHDHWRAMGVLGVHRYFDENESNVDYRSEENKNHHPAFWSWDAWVHAGWGNVEIDQVNERRINKQVRGINGRIKRYNAIRNLTGGFHSDVALLESVDVRLYRQVFSKDLKMMKKYNDRLRRNVPINQKILSGIEKLKMEGKLSEEQLRSIDNEEIMSLPNTLDITLPIMENKIKELNRSIDEMNLEHNLSIRRINVSWVNYDNYHKVPEVIERTLWQMKRFRLFYVDAFGILHLHSVLPFSEETKKIDVQYGGFKGLQALELMQTKVQVFFEKMETIPDTPEWRKYMWDELGEIFTIVNSWYSDKTKLAKPGQVDKFVRAGGVSNFTDILEHNSDRAYYSDRQPKGGILIGHNERKKFDPEEDTTTPLPWMVPFPESETLQILIDWQMSEGYASQGGIFTIFKRDDKGKVTGIRAWGYKESNGTEIEDITRENLKILSKEAKSFLLRLSTRKEYAPEQQKFLRELAKEEADSLFVEEKEFLENIAVDHDIYADLDDFAKERMQKLMKVLVSGQRLGLSHDQKQMIRNLSDGEWFMRWYQMRALKEVYVNCNKLIEEAEEKAREGKKHKYEEIRDNVADELERFGILVRPSIVNALDMISGLKSDLIFLRDEFFNLRVEDEKFQNYEVVMHKQDKKNTEENINKEVAILEGAGLIEKTEGGYRASSLIGELDKSQISVLVDRIPELISGEISASDASKIHDDIVKVKADLIHEQSLVEGLIDSLLTSEQKIRGVYHLLPVSLIPEAQRWIIQKIKSSERNFKIKEKIKFLSEEEFENYDVVARQLIARGYLVDIALVNPEESDVEKLNAEGLKGKVKALVFQQDEIGNFQQIEGIICALRALYCNNNTKMANALEEIYKLLTGSAMDDEMKECLYRIDTTDPVAMYKMGIVFNLPPITIHDWKRLKEINKILQKVLMQA